MDKATFEMLLTAYDETAREALARGLPPDIANKEGNTAAAMFFASCSGIDDEKARIEIEELNLKAHVEIFH